jgi:hypothetical protein
MIFSTNQRLFVIWPFNLHSHITWGISHCQFYLSFHLKIMKIFFLTIELLSPQVRLQLP